MGTSSTLIFLLALVRVYTAPAPNPWGNIGSATSELLSSSKGEQDLLLVEETKQSQCEKSCRVCDATGKLQSDGSCKCYSENGGELVCLNSGVVARDLTGRGERCSADTLGSATPGVLQSQALTAAQRSLEEFRQRVETLRELTLENMRRITLLGSTPKLPSLDPPTLPNTDATLGIPAPSKIESLKLSSPLEMPTLPKIELPKLPSLPALPAPKLATTFNLPSTLPNLPRLEPIKIPSIEIPKLDARIPQTRPTIQLPTLPKLDLNIPKLPSLPTSKLPVSPFLGTSGKEEVEIKGEELEQQEKRLEKQETELLVGAPNPEENETEPKSVDVSLNIPSENLGSQLSGLSLPSLNRRGFLPSGQMNYRIPQFSSRFQSSPRISRSSQPATDSVSSIITDKEASSEVLHEVETQSDNTENHVKTE